MEKIEYGEFLRLRLGKIEKYGEKQDIRIEDNRYIDYSGEYEWETRIVKHSSNIIDLIEVGDYVNGHKVVNEIWGEDDNNLYFEIEGGFNKAQYIGEKNIKSILTKEQFELVEYKLYN